MKKILIILLFAFLMYNCSGTKVSEKKVRVAVAANAFEVFKLVAKEFEKKTGIKCEIISGSSGKLTRQIINGAPYHVFLAANMKYPKTLFKKGLATALPKIYAKGALVLWSMLPSKLEKGLKTLESPSISKLAIANPEVAPYGVAAVQAFKALKVYDNLKEKLVYAQNISKTNHYITTKTVDMGITAKSAVMSKRMKNKGKWIEIPVKYYSPVLQGMVITKYGEKNLYAEKLYKFVLSETSVELFKKAGYVFD